MKRDTIILGVPRRSEYTETVESFADLVEPHLNGTGSDMAAFELKVVLSEAFTNLVRHDCSDSNDLVHILFEIDPTLIRIQIHDIGRGFSIQNHYPPYPDSTVGTYQVMSKTMDGTVVAHVETPFTLALYFKPDELDEMSDSELRERATDGGMGLSLMTKIMDEVRFTAQPNARNHLEMVKKKVRP